MATCPICQEPMLTERPHRHVLQGTAVPPRTHWHNCYRSHLDCANVEIERLRKLATMMAEELSRWGWGDMHYGPQPQERSVVAVLDEYRRVLQIDGSAGDG